MENFEACLNSPEDFICDKREVVKALKDDIQMMEELRDGEIDELVNEDVDWYKSLIDQFCSGCSQINKEKADEVTSADVAKSRFKKVMKPREVERFAIKNGFLVTQGNGKHTLHVVAKSGESRPLPTHPGDLSPGVTDKLMGWMWTVLSQEREKVGAV